LTFTASSFGRRASDGGANLHIFHQQHSNNINNDEDGGWSQPGSREQLQPVSVLQRYIFHIKTIAAIVLLSKKLEMYLLLLYYSYSPYQIFFSQILNKNVCVVTE